MNHHRKGRLWYYGFLTFYNVIHPQFGPLKLLRKAVQSLRSSSPRPHGYLSPKPLPKKIWIFWAQGWEDAPPLIQLCRDSWVKHNPDWEICFLSNDNLPDYVTLDYPLPGKDITVTGYSNIVRLNLLEKYGGVWADATLFCTAPLSTWLPYLMQSGFFVFNKPKTTVASWFMGSEKNNVLIRNWESRVRHYWLYTKKPRIYFWVQYMFEYMIWSNKDMRRLWEETPHVNADGAYAAQRCLKEERSVAECVDTVFSGASPVHKLSWKIQIPDSFLSELRSRLSKS